MELRKLQAALVSQCTDGLQASSVQMLQLQAATQLYICHTLPISQ